MFLAPKKRMLLTEAIKQSYEATCLLQPQEGWTYDVRNTLRYLNANLWTLDDKLTTLAQHIKRFNSYTRKRFQQCLGICMRDYLIQHRLACAERLLSTLPLSIGFISNAVGYPSMQAFNNAFKKKHGCSPTQWKKQQQAHFENVNRPTTHLG